MTQYYVEGLFINKQVLKKARKMVKVPASLLEPYARTIWANTPKEALQIATTDLAGGEWAEGPKVSQVTEEQRMRSQGAPEFPGLFDTKSKKRKS